VSDATRRAEFLKVSAPWIGEEETAAMLDTVASGWVTTGPRVAEFQRRLEDHLDVPHVRCLSSCTAGLELALRVAGVGRGDEVLVPTMTFVACASVVERLGARPVLVDSHPDTGLIDLDHAAARLTPATTAMIPVHLGGHPLDMDALNAFRDRHGLVVVEDAAHAMGASWRGRRIGAHGNRTAFSFHASKNITTFEGGALALTSRAEADRARRLSMHGLDRSAWVRHDSDAPAGYDVLEPGTKCVMTDVAAAVGLCQLDRLGGWIERRAQLAAAYDERLAGLPLDLPPHAPEHAQHAHHLYMVRVRDDAPRDRDDVVRGLRDARIGTTIHFTPIHRFTYYRTRYGLRPEEFPAAEERGRQVVTLPLFPAMEESDVDDVAGALAGLLA
jgi:dTDP-4-amino-4,6-dideoxygalactose transaminase